MGSWSLLGYRDADPMGDSFPLEYRSQQELCGQPWVSPHSPPALEDAHSPGDGAGKGQLYLGFARRVLVHAVLGSVTTLH